MQLARARFRDLEDRANLLEIELVVVVQGHHELFALGKSVDRTHERIAKTFLHDVAQRVGLILCILNRILVEARQLTRRGVLQDAVIVVKRDTHSIRHFEIARLAAELLGLAIYKVQSNAYKYSWALIPISVPFVWLLFPFSRRFHIYDHTVFVTYSLCFMTLLVVVLTLGMAAGLPGMGLLAMLLPPWHMFRQLREADQLRRRSALWRTVLLVFFANTAIGLFAMLVLTQAGA